MEIKVGDLEIVSNKWIENNILLLVTEDKKDQDGDVFHLEAECEIGKSVRFSKCYSQEVLPYESTLVENDSALFYAFGIILQQYQT